MAEFHFKILSVALAASLALIGSAAGEQVAHYRMNEGFGTVAYDSSGHGNHGRIHGPRWVSSGAGHALHFDGEDDYVDCGDDASLDMR